MTNFAPLTFFDSRERMTQIKFEAVLVPAMNVPIQVKRETFNVSAIIYVAFPAGVSLCASPRGSQQCRSDRS